ncbi:MAG: methyltransferase domain-containing protein [Chloroflexota bacterium]
MTATDLAHPFDAAAPGYDQDFTDTTLGRWLRQTVLAEVARLFAPRQRVLELGCGTGQDAVWLAQRGVHVTATDVAPAMLAAAAEKARAAGVADRIAFSLFDLNRPAEAEVARQVAEPYDGVLANFGPLNCVADRRALADVLGRLVRPGGAVCLVVMNPLCPWEVAWHLAHAQPAVAFRRLRGRIQAHVGSGRTVAVWYPSARRLRREFAPVFRHVRTVGVGALLPPCYLHHLVGRSPRLFTRLAAWDGSVGRGWPGGGSMITISSCCGAPSSSAARAASRAPAFCFESQAIAIFR